LSEIDLSGLFEPIHIKGVTIRNRFVMPGMQRGWCEQGRPMPIMHDYYRKRVLGGVGLVIGEASLIDHPSSRWESHYPRLNPDTYDAWASTIDAVHEAGGRIFLQLSHPGAIRLDEQARPDDPYPALSPSGLFKGDRGNGRAATLAELEEIRDAFVSAARFAQKAGADGVEIHGCHGYFIDQFLWAETNRREDRYGGATIAERVRYPAELVSAVRDAVGAELLISFRFSQWKEVDYKAKICETPDDLQMFLSILRDSGVDIFHPSVRRFDTPEWAGSDLGLAGWTKSFTDALVIAVGSVGLTVDFMESLIGNIEGHFPGEGRMRELARRYHNGEFDMVAVGRSLISDPEWVNKVRAQRFDEIKPFVKQDLGKALEMESRLIVDVHRDGEAGVDHE
jgi:2,4-dienoyl-CoA reductase-like NADH-dependent reductase (Old Yellow Enzyme family)